ncbi:hypothetical protein PGB90_010044 [Kerria lacca]
MIHPSFIVKVKNSLLSFVQYGCVIHCFFEHIAELAICVGPSMEPTLSSNDVIVTEHLSPMFKKFNYGDIVVSKSLNNPKEFVCKRIIGLPGDRIYFNKIQIVPNGYVWLEGDNRENSTDSREYGPVPQGLITGRVICKIWPLKEVMMLTVKSK